MSQTRETEPIDTQTQAGDHPAPNPPAQKSNNPLIQESNNPPTQQSNNPLIQESNNPPIQTPPTGLPTDPRTDSAHHKSAFAKAKAFGKLLLQKAGKKLQDSIFLWDHGSDVEPWPEPVDGAALLDAIEATVKRFAVLPRWAAETLALWVLHTYAFLLRDVSTYIGLESPQKRCGKTTVLSLMCELVNRPIVAANISSPAFFRVIEEATPTLMIDEGDTLLRGNDQLRGILNAGYYEKTAYVVRVDHRPAEPAASGSADLERDLNGIQAERANRPPRPASADSGTNLARFSSWCPKMIATIKHLPETLRDRCIIIQMQRKKPPTKNVTG